MARQGDDLSGRDLSGADLSGTNLKHTDLSGADLSDADLSGANLKHTDLSDADLSGADLSGTNLEHATLVGADLTDATLTGAQLGHATFEDGGGSNAGDLSSLVGSLVTGVTLLVGFALLAAGVSNFWLAFVIGFAVVLPVAAALAGWYEDRTAEAAPDEDEQTEALAELRRRYADGEIDEAEFERRVEGLLETESVAEAEDAFGASSTGGPESSAASPESPAAGPESSGSGTESDSQPEREIE